VGRRALVAGLTGAAALALVGCDSGSPDNDLPGASEAEQDADVVLVGQALGLCDDAADQLTALAGAPAAQRRLAGAIGMHRAHAAALRDAAPASPSRSPSPSSGTSAAGPPELPLGLALSRARDIEKHAHDGLVALAQQARSGQLARLLASMAAGTSQRLVGLAR
jgi:hypothetical protein